MNCNWKQIETNGASARWECTSCHKRTGWTTDTPDRIHATCSSGAHYLLCEHRGEELLAISAKTAGCGCGSMVVSVYACRYYGEPVLKTAAARCLPKLQAVEPTYTGRTCRHCVMPASNVSRSMDVLHVARKVWSERVERFTAVHLDRGANAEFALAETADDLHSVLRRRRPRVVFVHAYQIAVDAFKTAAINHPTTQFVSVFHGSQNHLLTYPDYAATQLYYLELTRELRNCWYATPENHRLELVGWERAVTYPNPYSLSEFGPQDPPLPSDKRLLIVGRLDIVKALPMAMIAAGIVVRHSPDVRVSVLCRGPRHDNVRTLAKTAGIDAEFVAWKRWPTFREYLRNRVSVTLQPSLTESWNYVALESMSQSRPCIGSPAIRYLPKQWQADPNDPRDIASRVLTVLDGYDAASRLAYDTAYAVATEQNTAFAALTRRLLSS